MKRAFLFWSILTVLLVGCGNYQAIVKSNDFDAKYKAAVTYFENKDYFRSMPLFQELISHYKGTTRAEQIYYYYSYCQFHLDDYSSASYHFKNFARTFPSSKYAEECEYMNAYCYYLDSPNYNLDQANTHKGIGALQLFINMYPKSERIKECNELIDKLRYKLEKKTFENAKLYHKIFNYHAAILAFDNFLLDYPSTNFKEEALFLALKSSYIFAVNSQEKKKEKRLEEVANRYDLLIKFFPKSTYLKESDVILQKAKAGLNLIAGNNGI